MSKAEVTYTTPKVREDIQGCIVTQVTSINPTDRTVEATCLRFDSTGTANTGAFQIGGIASPIVLSEVDLATIMTIIMNAGIAAGQIPAGTPSVEP